VEAEPVGIFQYVVIVILAMMSGAFSGLNLGLLGLDVRNLEMLIKIGGKSSEDVTDE